MSSTLIVLVGLLVCFVCVGDALQCYVYQCTNYSSPFIPKQPCAQPKPVTCGLSLIPGQPADRCVTQRMKIKMSIGGQDMIMYQETRNCTSSLMCNSDLICKQVSNMQSMTVKKCELGCCKGDLCNSGVIPTAGPKPTGPSGSDLTCYSCSSKPKHIPGFPGADCKNPVKQTCGPDLIPGMKQDRCVRIKIKAGSYEAEIRNCSGFAYCGNPDAFCKITNTSGNIKSCDVSCCYGNLCNIDTAPTTLSPGGRNDTAPTSTSGPAAGNDTTPSSTSAPAVGNDTTPTSTSAPGGVTVPGSASILAGTMTCLLVMIARALGVLAEMM